MKLFRIRYLGIMALAVMLLGGCKFVRPGHDVSARAEANATRHIVAAYNVSGLLAQADSVLTQSLMDRLPDAVDGTTRQQLRQIINHELRAGALTQAVRQRLAREAQRAGRAGALVTAARKLQTPLAVRMLALQDNAGDDGFASAYNEFLRQLPDAKRKRRLRKLETLLDSRQLVAVQDAFQNALLQTMVNSRNALTTAGQDISSAALERMLDKSHRTLSDQMHEQVPLILLYVYRDVDDAALQRYVELQSLPALKWTNQALVSAIRDVLESAGQRITQRVGQLG